MISVFSFSGLDDCILPYAHFFLNNNVVGQGLLNLTVDDLYKLHVEKLGHQEIILEALELLKNLVRNRKCFEIPGKAATFFLHFSTTIWTPRTCSTSA